MNIFTQLARHFLVNKTLLIELFQAYNFSTKFIDEFRRNRLYVDEDLIRRKIRTLCELTQDEYFKDLCCHDEGIQLVFHTSNHEHHFIRYRICIDVKLIAVLFNQHNQIVKFLINTIQLKPLNIVSKPFRFCAQYKIRTLVVDELERICVEQHIPCQRLFNDIKRPLIYRIDLCHIKELDHLRQRHLFIGNRSILDIIEITHVEHREQAIVLGYRLRTSIDEELNNYQHLTVASAFLP